MGYAFIQSPTLITFLDDGHLEITNNRTENAICPLVVGRKTRLFAGAPTAPRPPKPSRHCCRTI
ncbi:MAG TPA: hypothetical protein DDY14_08610 [Chromatiaceae bacterium]|nr:MAG: transposase [Thiohalocapsa sp. PB-PSB1]QQO58159.1 MAG: transposase [Thiohalocapsa sp. PB-PSB1]HBG95369.1 hypothetical protein [Chromatiaceae bacterium]